MKKLGISVYPTRDSKENIIEFIELASKYNVTRIFTNLLEVKKSADEVINDFVEINTFAKSKNMEVIIDVAPNIFQEFNISYDDLKFFADLKVDGIRLDEGFDGIKEASMTRNPYGLKIEINASVDTGYVDQILSFDADKSQLITCHNFYPQRYTALGFDYFEKCSRKYKDLGLRVAAFAFSNNPNAFGVWEEYDGLPTLEMHRDLPMDLQIRHLSMLDYLDDIIISNCYPTKEEFEVLEKIDLSKLNIRVDLNPNNSEVENEIIKEYPHLVRGDMSEYMVRSTMCRIDYKDHSIKAHDTKEILEVGDVVILNDEYGRYKGELHIVLKEMKNDGKKNLVGRVKEEELFLLEYLVAWRKFNLLV